MRAALIVVLGWLLIGVQSSVLHAFPAVPDFLVPLAVYFGFSREVLRGAALAGLLGYFADLLCGGPRGLHVIVAMVLAMLASVLSTRLFLRGTIFTAVLTALASTLSQLVTIGLLSAFYRGFNRSDLLFADLLPVLIATTLVGPLVFWACGRIDALWRKAETRRFGGEAEEEE